MNYSSKSQIYKIYKKILIKIKKEIILKKILFAFNINIGIYEILSFFKFTKTNLQNYIFIKHICNKSK